MDGILLVRTPPEISSRIRDGLTKACIEEIATEDAITSALDGRVGNLGALVIGPRVESPVRAAERASAVDPDLAATYERELDEARAEQDLPGMAMAIADHDEHTLWVSATGSSNLDPQTDWLPTEGLLRIGFTAGASTPDTKLAAVINRVCDLAGVDLAAVLFP